MCRCTPEIKTPFCGEAGCEWPEQIPRSDSGHILNPPHLSDILRAHGSFRRLMENYWTGRLSVMEEAVLEDKYPRETLVSYKPVTVKPESLRLDSVDTVVEILEAVMTTSHNDAHSLACMIVNEAAKRQLGHYDPEGTPR